MGGGKNGDGRTMDTLLHRSRLEMIVTPGMMACLVLDHVGNVRIH